MRDNIDKGAFAKNIREHQIFDNARKRKSRRRNVEIIIALVIGFIIAAGVEHLIFC